jgi:hypothetical protein
VHPETNEPISEHAINELKDGELIEERFEGDDYRLMVVANKFQTGFDQPLLALMFLDKPVVDRNAVQTSTWNRQVGAQRPHRPRRRCGWWMRRVRFSATRPTSRRGRNDARRGSPPHVVIRSLVVPGSDVPIRRSSRRFTPCSLRSTFCDLCHTIPGEVRF